MIEPLSRDKSTLYGGSGRQRTKNTEIVLFVLTILASAFFFLEKETLALSQSSNQGASMKEIFIFYSFYLHSFAGVAPGEG